MSTATATAAYPTYRVTGKCHACGTKMAADVTMMRGTQCACGAWTVLKRVWGSVTSKPCNGVCMGAVGPSCDCACGGQNHGSSHLGA